MGRQKGFGEMCERVKRRSNLAHDLAGSEVSFNFLRPSMAEAAVHHTANLERERAKDNECQQEGED